ncbi:pyruvate kinase [Nematocida sp. AWRm77]|nr:pyruvate kinase [Nematocida sp. AWRm77]
MYTNKAAPTKIVCTIGPACASEESVKKMIDEGMAIARVNFSHGTEESHRKVFDMLNKVREEEKYCTLGIAVDTKGPEIRTGCFPDKSVTIQAESLVELTTDSAYKEKCTESVIFVDHENIIADLENSSAKKIYIDDGKLELEVVSIGKDRKSVCTRAKTTAVLSSQKGVNIPGACVSLPGITDKDRRDILFGAEHGADFVFASFVRTAKNVQEIRALPGTEHLKIVSKIESQEGLSNLDEIIDVSDGIMVARGDLGIETHYALLFFHQCVIASKCLEKNKPFIVATQMLDSLEKCTRPTRAEITDVGVACAMSAGCAMLSGETAAGCCPVNAVSVMQDILFSTAGAFCTRLSDSRLPGFLFPTAQTFSLTIRVLVSDNKRYLRSMQMYNGCFSLYSPTPSPECLPLLPEGYTMKIENSESANEKIQ